MATKGHARGGVRASAWQKVLAILMAAMLGLTACAPAKNLGDIVDNETPLSATGETEQPADEATEADQAEAPAEEPAPEAAYSQTLEDGTVVSSDAMDVSDMDIEVVKVQEEAPAAVEMPAEAVDTDTADGTVASSDDLQNAMAAAMGLSSAATGASAMDAAPSTVGGLTITGGTVNTDFTHAANEALIKKSGTYTLSGSFSGTVKIDAGVDAWLILNGVTITANNASSPINLLKGATAHIILADGTTNTLNANQQGCAALHCGDGSTLYIDDAVVNYDYAAKRHIDVLYGVVDTPGEVTNLATGAKHNVAKGDILKKVTSAGVVGKLIAKGGKGAAGIGAGPKEVSGTMVFDGGYIEAYSWGGHSNNHGNNSAAVGTGVTNAEGVNVNDSSGTGIGGGAGGGGATQTTFNGGTIYAFGSYHGAGIGAGWSSAGTLGAQTGASSVTRNANNCGNININGGYILSQGYAHGNAFGGACGTNMTNNTVRITGGTLRPFSHTSRADIGGSGGYVIIDGGSISLSGTQAAKFMSSNNKAYSDVARTQEVVPIEVDLAAETGTVDYTITNWALFIDGVQQAYGAPYSFNAGKLTLWLPPTARTQKVTVELNYYNESTGSEVLVEPLYREAGSTASTVKRNVYFDMPVKAVFGADVETETEALPKITNFPNELLVDGKVPENITAIQKKYDGLPFETIEITNLSITESKSREVRALTNNDLVTYSYRLLNGNTFSDELTGAQMPSDTGLMAFAMNSTEFAQGEWGKSYIGHRSNGWCRIVPVPAILTLEGAEWGNLNLETGEFVPTTTKDDEPGNRIKVTMNVRSAIGTAVTCKTPTGKVQLTIDNKKFGEPIELTEEYVTADGFGTYTVSEGPTEKSANTEAAMASADNRWTAHIVYYMDPAQADGLLAPKASKRLIAQSKSDLANAETAADVMSAMMDNVLRAATPEAYAADIDEKELGENEHKLSGEYIPDKNYVEGTEKNPQNADATATIIIPVDTPVTVTDDQNTTYDFKEVTDPAPDGTPSGRSATSGVKTMEASVVKNYSDFHGKDKSGKEITKDYFVLTIESESAMPMEWHSSDPAVADVMRDDEGNVVYDENGNPKIQVHSCGDVVITMHQNGNAIYNEQEHIIKMRVAPDASLKPATEARVIWNNLTHPGLPAAPGDEIEYIVIGSNLTDGSAWQDVELGDMVPSNVTINPGSVQTLKNFGTPEDLDTLTAEELDQLLKEQGLEFEQTETPDIQKVPATDENCPDGSQFSTNVGSIYGGQSTAVKFTVKVNDNIADRASITGDNPPVIPNTPTASGSYGVKEAQDMAPGEEPGSPVPVTDTVVIGIDRDDNPQAAVLPKDPVLSGPEAEVYVQKTAQNLTAQAAGRTAPVTLPGDEVTYSITVGNKGIDSCLYYPFIMDTLPEGLTPVSGSFELTKVDGSTIPVGDNVYVAATRTIALYVDDLYGGESTTLTFKCAVGDDCATADNVAQVLGTDPSDRWKGQHPDPIVIDPDEPVVPDGPKASDILGGTLEEPEPGQPADPENPDGTDPENPGTPAPGVKVGPVGPTGPFADAVLADPEDPTVPADPTDPEDPASVPREPIQPGDVIVKFGDKVPPASPQDIADELDRLIKKAIEEDPEADVVNIPVTVQRTNPETGEVEDIDVIVPVPITPEVLGVDPGVPMIDPANPPVPGTPWTPDPSIPTEDYPWDNFNPEEFLTDKPKGQTPEPATPGVLIPSRDPVVHGDPSDIKVEKTAENLSSGNDGDTYVGDRVRYTITVTDTKPGTTWFNVIVRDNLPKGVDIDMATAKLKTALGVEAAVAADAYNPMTRILAVNMGDVPGGMTATLTFEADITEMAASNDVGNIANAYGTVPSQVNPDDLDPAKRPAPGSAFNPPEGWDKYDQANPPLTNADPAYPSKNAKENGVRPAVDKSAVDEDGKPLPATKGDGNGGAGNNWATDVAQKFLQLAQTGDPLVVGMTSLVLVAAAAGFVLILMGFKRRKAEEAEKPLSAVERFRKK